MDQQLPDEILTFKEFLALWVGSEKTLRRRLDDGSIPKYQPGGPGTLIGIPRSALSSSHSALPQQNQQQETNPNNMVQIPGPKPSWRK